MDSMGLERNNQELSMSNMEEVLDGEASELYKLLHGIDTDYNKNLMSETIEAEKSAPITLLPL